MADVKDQQASFEAFDQGQKGSLTKVECGMAIRALCKNPLETDLQAAMQSMGDNISFANFQALYNRVWPKPEQQDQDLRKLLQMLDHDDNGRVQEGEFRQLLLSVGDVLSHQEVDLLFEEVPVDDSGFFRYDMLVDKLVGGHMPH